LYYSQDFSKAFTTQYLERYLAEPVKLCVGCIDHNRSFRVRMKMGRGASSKRAVITTGWAKAMETYQYEEDDIVMFLFEYTDHLELLLCRLDP
jgi:hypothetical protein